jgi:hypothetical protein
MMTQRHHMRCSAAHPSLFMTGYATDLSQQCKIIFFICGRVPSGVGGETRKSFYVAMAMLDQTIGFIGLPHVQLLRHALAALVAASLTTHDVRAQSNATTNPQNCDLGLLIRCTPRASSYGSSSFSVYDVESVPCKVYC